MARYNEKEKDTDKAPVEKFPNIYDYIIDEETSFRTDRIPLASNYDWNMFEHIDRSYQLKNSQFYKGTQDYSRPFNNIILPIANVAYRSEGFDIKDVELYVEVKDYYHLSLLGRKYHNKWAIENSVDTSIDESVESYFDYGLALVKDENEKRPNVIKLKTKLAFCDQTDVLSGPICLKHEYSIDEIMEMSGKWDKTEVKNAIRNSRFVKRGNNESGEEAKTPGKNIEVYELHGMFPESWLGEDYFDESWEDTGKYSRQMHIVTFYTDASDKRNGATLFKGEIKQIFKALKRDEVEGRACGRGGIEELFHPQIWTNYSEIHMQQMLENVSKIISKTNDKKLAKDNKLSTMKNGHIVYLEDGKTWDQMAFQAPNKAAFDNYINKWEQVARTIGSASDPQLGLNPTSGTPLGTTQIVTNQGLGIHEYRRGKIATFWGEIYRDWVLKHIQEDLSRGDEWLDELSLDELKEVAEKVTNNQVNIKTKEAVLNGKTVTDQDKQIYKDLVLEELMKGGKKRFLKIMQGEFKDLPVKVKFNIAGKQNNLAEIVNKLNSVFAKVFTPEGVAMLQQNEGVADLFNNILESSGFSPVNFASFTKSVASPVPTNQLEKPLANNV